MTASSFDPVLNIDNTPDDSFEPRLPSMPCSELPTGRFGCNFIKTNRFGAT